MYRYMVKLRKVYRDTYLDDLCVVILVHQWIVVALWGIPLLSH